MGKNDQHVRTRFSESMTRVSLFQLFQFANAKNVCLVVVGIFFAIAAGLGWPMLAYTFGTMLDSFLCYTALLLQARAAISNTTTAEQCILEGAESVCALDLDLVDEVEKAAIQFSIAGFVVWISYLVYMSSFGMVAEQQTKRIRETFFQAVMRQDMGWFDTTDPGELTSHLTVNMDKIYDGISDGIGSLVNSLTTCIGGIILGIVIEWRLSLIVLSVTPVLAFIVATMSKFVVTNATNEQKAYAKADSTAEEAISSIRTVIAFGGEELEAKRYESAVVDAQRVSRLNTLILSVVVGVMYFLVFGTCALAFWYVGYLVRTESASAGKKLIAFIAVLRAAFALGNIVPSVEMVSAAKGAAVSVFSIISLKPKIDSLSAEGSTVAEDKLNGDLEFGNVSFSYSARPDKQVLTDINLTIKSGETLALVGPSGSGKSTIVQLIQRFYDPTTGEIYLDQHNLKSLNVHWLRKQIGVVSQEPVLFATTIAENIRYGHPDVSFADIVRAAKAANVHDFIKSLPEQYDTQVGAAGSLLSGGQKQRIAIARALVNHPKVLLLDEATSALDSNNEGLVQDALDRAQKGRTTVVIAHRLITVLKATKIAVIVNGVIEEMGSHGVLMAKKGAYYSLIASQNHLHHSTGEVTAHAEPSARDLWQRLCDVVHFQSAFVQRFQTFRQQSRKVSIKQRPERNKSFRVPGGSSYYRPSRISRNTLDRASRGQESLNCRLLSRQSTTFAIQVGNDNEPAGNEPAGNESQPLPPSLMQLIKLNISEWQCLLWGSVSAIVAGIVMPIFAYVFAEVLQTFTKTCSAIESQLITWSSVLVGIGVVAGLAECLKNYCLGHASEHLISRIRVMAFRGVLQQDVAWFDNSCHSVGLVCSRLAHDAAEIKPGPGGQIISIGQSFVTVLTTFTVSFIFNWPLTFVMLELAPILVIIGVVQFKVLAQYERTIQENIELANSLAVEAIANIQTVAQLTSEDRLLQRYSDLLKKPFAVASVRNYLVGFLNGLLEAMLFFAAAVVFRFGVWEIEEFHELAFNDVLVVFGCLVFGALSIGQALALSSDAAQARLAAAQVFEYINSKPLINIDCKDGVHTEIAGRVCFNEVSFAYPSRGKTIVLNKMNLTAEAGQTVAIVGASGCGKSTCIQLLQRFYDAHMGRLQVDGCDVHNFNVKYLRSQMALVSQEPVLFARSIRENIAYGDHSRQVSQQEVEDAASAANIHSFIVSLPNGYDTLLGEKGRQLSGGQKQRIAIARALIRKPKILLLDEATSALDSESEKVVQEALDRARQGRTCFVIAHHLATIEHADKIAVMREGQLIEEGTHAQLMQLQRLYYSFHAGRIA